MKFFFVKASIALFVCALLCVPASTQSSVHEITKDATGNFVLLRNHQPYWVQGAGADNPKLFKELAQRGGNSVRTWGVGANTGNLLDSAQANGLTVLLGLWVGHEAQGFDYNDPEKVANQLATFRHWVRTYKDHPAILGWGIGNEVNLNYSNLKVWDAVNDISRMIHEETGGKQLTCTVVAGTGVTLLNHLAERCTDLDFVGLNLYDGLQSGVTSVQNSNWNKPYMLTEWGVNGHWGTARTDWGAPIELNSGEKFSLIENRYVNHIKANQGILIGNYVFLWNFKNEGSQTWFGLWVRDHTTEMVDALQRQWTGALPANRAPRMQLVTINEQPQSSSLRITRPTDNLVEVWAIDFEGDSLSYEYVVQPWPKEDRTGLEDVGLTFSTIPGMVTDIQANRARLNFKPEHNNKTFRLYVLVRDPFKHIATASFPFKISFEEVLAANERPVMEDCFLRDGPYANTAMGSSEINRIEVKKSGTAGFNRIGLIKADLAQIPAEASRLYLRLMGQAPLAMQVKLSIDPSAGWEERIATYSDAKPADLTFLDEITVDENLQWYNWDISDLLTDPEFQDKTVTLVLEGTASYIGEPAVFNSKEAGFDIPRLLIDNTTAVRPHRMPSIHVFPNPTSRFLNIELGEPGNLLHCRIFDSTGRLFLEKYSGDHRIDISYLPAGAYHLEMITSNGGIIIKRIIKL